MDDAEKGRAYELLKRIYENDFRINDSIKAEVEELMMPEWKKELGQEEE